MTPTQFKSSGLVHPSICFRYFAARSSHRPKSTPSAYVQPSPDRARSNLLWKWLPFGHNPHIPISGEQPPPQDDGLSLFCNDRTNAFAYDLAHQSTTRRCETIPRNLIYDLAFSPLPFTTRRFCTALSSSPTKRTDSPRAMQFNHNLSGSLITFINLPPN